MTPQQIALRLQNQFGEKIRRALPDDKHPRIEIDAADWPPIAEFLKNDPDLQFDWLANLTGLDYVADNQFCVAYDLWSFDKNHRFAVKVFTPRTDDAHFPTVTQLWPAANWHEREALDFFGIHFDNHPDPRRILLADDWVGYPLRKDYVFPREYHGIPASVELDWQQKPNYP